MSDILTIQATRNQASWRVEEKWEKCDVIRVAPPAFLNGERRRACRYVAGEGYLLDPGYYLVLWPARGGVRDSDAAVRYLGPVATREAACLLQTSALGLGIVAPAPTPVPEPVVRPSCTSGRVGQLELEYA
ncbi:MAG: hypothetical protein AB1642_07305 [Pseudomonadota bacterium]